VVLSVEEARDLLAVVEGTPGLMIRTIYGTGMRLMECLRLRVKDVDFDRGALYIRAGKGRVKAAPTRFDSGERIGSHVARNRVLRVRLAF
jgi:integrase